MELCLLFDGDWPSEELDDWKRLLDLSLLELARVAMALGKFLLSVVIGVRLWRWEEGGMDGDIPP